MKNKSGKNIAGRYPGDRYSQQRQQQQQQQNNMVAIDLFNHSKKLGGGQQLAGMDVTG